MITIHTVDAVALLAAALATIEARVLFCVLMAVLAVCACLLLCGSGGSGYQTAETSIPTALKVFLLSYRFQMLGVDTTANTAKVIDLVILRYRAFVKLIGDAVCVPILLIVIPKYAVTVLCERAEPEPATGVGLRRNSIQQSFDSRASSKLVFSQSDVSPIVAAVRAVETLLRFSARFYFPTLPEGVQA